MWGSFYEDVDMSRDAAIEHFRATAASMGAVYAASWIVPLPESQSSFMRKHIRDSQCRMLVGFFFGKGYVQGYSGMAASLLPPFPNEMLEEYAETFHPEGTGFWHECYSFGHKYGQMEKEGVTVK